MSHKSGRPAASSPLDARALKSGRALQAALLALLERKPLEQITIREIAAEAGVHYATFFRHHQTKESLLDAVAADQIERLVALTLPVFDNVDGHASVMALCAYVDEHRTLWSALLTGAAGAMREELRRISRAVAAERARQDAWLPPELGVRASTSLIVETLTWWLALPAGTVSLAEVAAILHRLLFTLQALEKR